MVYVIDHISSGCIIRSLCNVRCCYIHCQGFIQGRRKGGGGGASPSFHPLNLGNNVVLTTSLAARP